MATEVLDSPEFSKFVLRVSFGMMFLLHGLERIRNGTNAIQAVWISHGFPGYFAHLVYITEVAVPILIIIGAYTRLSSFFAAVTCALAMYHWGHFFYLNDITGGWSLETGGVYFFAFVSLMFSGSGKIALRPD